MSNYIRDIEEQNEQLQKKLVSAEQRAINGDMASKVLKRVLQNTSFHLDKCHTDKSDKPVITLDISEVTITRSDLDEDCMNALIKLLIEIRDEQQEIREEILSHMVESYKKLST